MVLKQQPKSRKKESVFNWHNRRILVTGGASFIGSHLIELLIKKGASKIHVIDNLSSGRIENIEDHINRGQIEFCKADLLTPHVAQDAVKGIDVVFHLAAIHGGRGYVDLHQAACAQNLAIDSILIKVAYEAKVDKFIFASSGCVYPNYIQKDVKKKLYLTEDMVGPPYEADNMYGWAKLMTEMTLRSYYKDWGFKSASCRFFTVYGERGIENHAIVAMIARAFIGQNPFEVWGDGTQIRNWTYVGDIVNGMVRAAEMIDSGRAVNLGTEERTSVLEAAREILRYTGHKSEIKLLPDMPTGPFNRVASNRLAKQLLGWEPEMKFIDGLHKTIDWYFKTKDRNEIQRCFPSMLTE
ncbi:MAG: NAD-dependent epimerase/dehydratase family protein [Candidatus Omnitrophota bacterium]